MAFAGPFAHTAGILAGALGDDAGANRMLEQSVDTAQRLRTSIWVLQGKAALGGLRESNLSSVGEKQSHVDHAAITRVNEIWTVSWSEEHGSLPHVKGLADIAMLLRLRGQDVGERARKAVSARIRDAIGRTDAVAPLLAAHPDRSIKTGLQCHYSPEGDDALISWSVED